MSRKRKHIQLKVQLAAALLQLRRPDTGEHYISYMQAKALSAEQIISQFQLDHWPFPHAHDGPDLPWNLEWRLRAEHVEKTAKVDVPMMAKVARLRKVYTLDDAIKDVREFIRQRETKIKQKRKIPSRKLQSRPFPKRKKTRPNVLDEKAR